MYAGVTTNVRAQGGVIEDFLTTIQLHQVSTEFFHPSIEHIQELMPCCILLADGIFLIEC